ncbi:ABC transporter permease [Segnochrobactrum spirostomi]|uniref:Sugar ABC transporter permease n=1 Tax=Segnochrobactrum spirostomi TaxID=2608987 RepID=A0A6A7Y7L7_9HYPH|nr:ABC transporter permease [Segnochrobactrum spirostomi]MQT15273.1 sugar ABC transporter permease [Segnochrobactrum spirostomi]
MTEVTDERARATPSFLQSLGIQRRVIGALLVREALRRFGHENLGFFWVMVEPLLLVLGVVVLWHLIDEGHGKISITPFALTGYSMLTLFRAHVFRALKLVHSNSGLFFHQNIKVFDIMLARGALDTIAGFVAFLIAYVPLYLYGLVPAVRDPLLLICAWALCAWYSWSFGAILGAISEFSEAAEHIIHPMMYLTLPISGAFYMVSWLSPSAREVVLYAPLVNCMEMFRAGAFPASLKTSWNAGYVTAWAFAQTAVALPLMELARRRAQIK